MDMNQILTRLIYGLPCIIIALTIHEFFHAYVAFQCGDPSARYENRITLNPVAHFDPYGSVMLVISLLAFNFVLGWAKPVPVNEVYLRNPRRDVMLVSLAGPASNMCLALIAGILIRTGIFNSMEYIATFLLFLVRVNLALSLFNLIPCPPLDGWKIVGALVPAGIANKMKTFELTPRIPMIVLAIVIFSGIIEIVIGPPFRLLYGLFTGAAI